MRAVRVYLAAPYAAREQVRLVAAELRRGGYEITSSWLDETHEITDGTTGAAVELTDEQVSQHAAADLLDIDVADVLVAFTGASLRVANAGSGGRHVETGYALAKGLPIIVVGPPENVFHRLGRAHGVEVIASASVNDVMRALEQGLDGRRMSARLIECIAVVLDECGRAEASEAREILLGDDSDSRGFDDRDQRIRAALRDIGLR